MPLWWKSQMVIWPGGWSLYWAVDEPHFASMADLKLCIVGLVSRMSSQRVWWFHVSDPFSNKFSVIIYISETGFPRRRKWIHLTLVSPHSIKAVFLQFHHTIHWFWVLFVSIKVERSLVIWVHVAMNLLEILVKNFHLYFVNFLFKRFHLISVTIRPVLIRFWNVFLLQRERLRVVVDADHLVSSKFQCVLEKWGSSVHQFILSVAQNLHLPTLALNVVLLLSRQHLFLLLESLLCVLQIWL